ncbi:MAG: hypothetical protein JKY52_20565 [Flavobacteriales bacterium]|nr:hypothetical protein [Flavobacteriales bacterium]
MRRVITILLILGLISCGPEIYDDSEAKADNSSDTIPLDLSYYPDIANRTNISQLTDEIEKVNCVYTQGIGWAGKYTRQYACYERLAEIATKDELLKLINHSNPAVRVYAFYILRSTYPTTAIESKETLLNDAEVVCFFSGCVQMKVSVSMLVADSLDRKANSQGDSTIIFRFE